MKINIAYAPDNKYTNQTIVSMSSVIENNKKHEIEFIILYSELSSNNIEKFKKIESSNIKIRLLKINEKMFEKLKRLCYYN